MSLTTDEEIPSSSPLSPGVMSKRNQLTKIVSQKFNTDFTEEMLACDIDLDNYDEPEIERIVDDMKMEYDANGDGIIDDQEMNKIIRDAFILGLKNKGLKNDNAVLEKKVDNMSKHVKRNQMMSSVIIVLVMIVTFCATYFGTKASFDQGTVEVKNTITESVTTSVGVDTPDGRPHLQDSETGADVSTRSYGDSINARNLVDEDGTLVRCLSTEEVAQLAEDVQHGTDVRLSFVDPATDLATETFAVSMGDFRDENSYLSFGSNKVRIMLDSDICNQAVAEEDVSSDVGVEEPDVDAEPELEDDDYDIKLDIELALESAKPTVNGTDSDDIIFDRNLRRQQPVPPQDDGMIGLPSSSVDKDDDILKRHRAAYAAYRVAIQSGRQLSGRQLGGSSHSVCTGVFCENSKKQKKVKYAIMLWPDLPDTWTASDCKGRCEEHALEDNRPTPYRGEFACSYNQESNKCTISVEGNVATQKDTRWKTWIGELKVSHCNSRGYCGLG